ncbi:amidohydrolase family protein [Streptomyces halobius]|uniref:Amidohydrolase family protein n=1 Tax=Streptomyces halobius TaxID=2879846 RepID=A0ABY4M154_9ACTN|nr:amidohydrolase family protein [Streptomyces halobius]UQA90599.1 amidohydrolase family protein [Streptomyces halobius]
MDALISAGRVLTGPRGAQLADGAVLVRDGVIADVGPRNDLESRTSSGIDRFAFPEATLLPGLIDAHVHLALDAGPDPVAALRAADDADLILGMAGRALQLLSTGITTARDLGDRGGLALQLRGQIAGGRLPGPRILAAGVPLTGPGGHCWFLGGEVEGADAIREMVRHNAQSGVDVIKVMATGGGITKDGPPIWQAQFTTGELRIVVEEARAAGLPVAAHAHGTEGIAAAVAAGVSTIEHCTWMAPGGFQESAELVDAIVDQGIRVCPAASPDWRGFAERFGPDRAKEMFDRLGWMSRRGARLIAGTDAGVSRAVFDDFVSSLEFFEYIGLSPAEVVDVATIEAAEGLGIADDTGLLRAGYRADLLVVDGNPVDDLQALRRVRLVVAAGRRYVPEGAKPDRLPR